MGIIKDVDFKGHNIFILVCSIFIASIGLNINSTAVVIGAMLISPLMGPILGIGLAAGTNNFELFKRSGKSLGVATIAAIITSTIYFLITPLKEAQPELIARTTPTLLDALIAIFGGFAGIIAGSRKEKTNVVPGVAIATALMPPLCTAGYGLAVGNLSYFFGAFYLFLLNSVFICIATFIVVKYLRFPVKQFVDANREKLVKRYIYSAILLVLIPSGFIFYSVIKKTVFYRQANQFVVENVEFTDSEIINQRITYSDSLSKIEVFIMGEHVSAEIEHSLNKRLPAYGLEKTILKIHQAKDNTADIAGQLGKEVKAGIIEDLYLKNQELIEEKNKQIEQLNAKLIQNKKDSLPIKQLVNEVRINYNNLNKFGYALSYQSIDENTLDTVPVFLIQWNNKLSTLDKTEKQKAIGKWLALRLNKDTVAVINY